MGLVDMSTNIWYQKGTALLKMGEFGVELKNDAQSRNEMHLCIEQFYRDRNRSCFGYGDAVHSSIVDGMNCEETFSMKYLIDKKNFIRYHMPIDTRNFYAYLCLGIGPEYVNMRNLVNEENQSKFSMESTTEAVVHNLAMLDEYLAGRLL
jgi:hypothetical protein